MKSIKRMCIVISSIIAISGFAMINVSAETENWHTGTADYVLNQPLELANGDIGITISEGLDGYAVVTNGKGLDEGVFEGCRIYEETKSCDWFGSIPTSLKTDDSRYFVVDTSPTITKNEFGWFQEVYTTTNLRHIMLEADNIRSIAVISREADGIAQWDNDFIGVIEGSPVELDCSEYLMYNECMKELSEYQKNCTPYALLLAAQEKANELQENNKDKCSLVFPTITTTRISEYRYSYADLWTGIGDVGKDGNVNASDATDILIAAAHFGVGDEDYLTVEQSYVADVNADGAINAIDATIVLQYAAKVGIGETVEIKNMV